MSNGHCYLCKGALTGTEVPLRQCRDRLDCLQRQIGRLHLRLNELEAGEDRCPKCGMLPGADEGYCRECNPSGRID